MRNRILALLILSVVCIGALSACSSLLYYPVHEPYSDPSRFRHPPEDVYFQAEDGVQLHAWYFKTDQRPAKGTILFFHGNAQNLTTHFFGLYWILDRGFDYLIFDYRGYGLSEGKPSPEGTVKDGRAALSWLVQHKDSATPLYIFGQSLGGAIAMKVACTAPKPAPFEKVIIDSSFVSYRKAAQRALSKSWLTWPLQWIGWLVMNDEFAPKECVGDISPRPLLIVHGTDDPVIDFHQGERVYELAHSPKEFWVVEGGRHTDFLFRDKFRYQSRLIEWILHGPTQPESVQHLTPRVQ